MNPSLISLMVSVDVKHHVYLGNESEGLVYVDVVDVVRLMLVAL